MNQVKRQLTVDQSPTEETKKLRNEFDVSITCFENLSNEIFCEIFDDMNGLYIYQAFSNLNYRFQQLISSSLVRFKIYSYPSLDKLNTNIYQQLVLNHKHQIISIDTSLPYLNSYLFLNIFNIDSSFERLESLIIKNIEGDLLISVLINLISLSRLFSLTIQLNNKVVNLNHVYQLIFVLPALKYNKLTIGGDEHLILLSMATNKQLSTIECLIIENHLTFNELFTIISYTPKLYRLHFHHTYKRDKSIKRMLPMTLSNLTYLSICISVKFNHFEIFIRKIHSKLKYLSVNISSKDITFLDAYRWEELILQNLPQLEKLSFQYFDRINDEYEYPSKLNQFCSSFWMKRKWVFGVEIVDDYIVYFIHPYKKRWYEYVDEKIINCSTDLFKFNPLILNTTSWDVFSESINMKIQRSLTLVQIYHLSIPEVDVIVNELLQILDALPDLISIKIFSLSLAQPKDLYKTRFDVSYSTKKTNKITKFCLDSITDMEEVYVVMKLCPYIVYLKIDWITDINEELFVEDFFKKINEEFNNQLRLLCFNIEAADDKTIEKLERLIHLKKLCLDYTIKREVDHIFLQWK
ncbi:unnamed protein product [Adineta steineri]|uniref:F-box domain-containing protein n=1 Tax=Adineta steineri TaxID=433720 RepID=A0A814FGK2_9BILA|nr:unnamed protein product [Adineta steineri]CAF1012349.1 unnamed protein product [Adineta steineri]CAF1050941.1 unnamed protein product [Adineta steineri]